MGRSGISGWWILRIMWQIWHFGMAGFDVCMCPVSCDRWIYRQYLCGDQGQCHKTAEPPVSDVMVRKQWKWMVSWFWTWIGRAYIWTASGQSEAIWSLFERSGQKIRPGSSILAELTIQRRRIQGSERIWKRRCALLVCLVSACKTIYIL